MQQDFWHRRWAKDEIGFHLSEVNPLLIKYWQNINPTEGDTVFVPLCGKSKDLLWLAQQGFQVIGAELSQKAVEDFFEEHQLSPIITEKGALSEYRCENIRIFCGDIFKLTADDIDHCHLVYDRASLIAFPPEMRAAYAEKLEEVFPDKRRTLLITLEYPQQQMDGPPFAVLSDEVDRLFSAKMNIKLLQSDDILDASPRFKDKGLTQFIERVFTLVSK